MNLILEPGYEGPLAIIMCVHAAMERINLSEERSSPIG